MIGVENRRVADAPKTPPEQPSLAIGGRETPPWPLRTVLYPGRYVWYIFLSALDLMLTWVVLHLEGQELNVVAAWVIHRYDLRGLVVFKFVLVVTVILICEIVGRRNDRAGRILAIVAAGVTAIPVCLSLTELFNEFYR
jgi:hypothetical protein